MGGYVVTSAVRILSDVFDPETMRDGLNNRTVPAVEKKDKQKLSKMGYAFSLGRLVLV
jgi:hypothetical protein